MVECKFKDFDCFVELLHYPNDVRKIQLYDKEDGMPVATGTSYLPNEQLEPGEVAINDYSENQGMYRALLKSEIILPSHRTVRSGYITCPISFLSPIAQLVIKKK